MKRLLALLLLIVLLDCPCALAEAGVIDCTDSYAAYAAEVAKYNDRRGPYDETLTPKSVSPACTAVLLRTDGAEPDLTGCRPAAAIAGPGHRYTLLFDSQPRAAEAAAYLASCPHILYAEEDTAVYSADTAVTEDIPFMDSRTDLMGFDKMLSWAHRNGTGSVTVAVVDSGVYPHELLRSRLVLGPDLVDKDRDAGHDEFGHGTHVAGIIADCTQGLPVSLYAVRVLDARGSGYASNTANGILTAMSAGADIINLSLVTSRRSAVLDDAVITALNAGCTVVVAAGNKNISTEDISPSHLTENGVIVVGAAASPEERASFSNWGQSVDMYAYGVGIRSCANDASGCSTRSGTSQASPYIAAACALLKVLGISSSPSGMESTLRSVLTDTAAHIPQLDRLVPQYFAFHLDSLLLSIGEMMLLPDRVYPAGCAGRLAFISDNPDVLSVAEDGIITALQPGEACLTITCSNFSSKKVTVTVTEDSPVLFMLPGGLTTLDSESFSGLSPDRVLIPASLTDIMPDAFDTSPLFLCSGNKDIAEKCEMNGWQYVE